MFEKRNVMIHRKLQAVVENKLFRGKAIILTGARQVGKSTLCKEIVNRFAGQSLTLDCDEPEVKELLTDINSARLKMLVGKSRIVFIDEAQRVPEIGMTLKRFTDNFPEVQLLVSGSSSFELQNRLNEPLTGRKYEYRLYPVSTTEIIDTNGMLHACQMLEFRLVYGSYPDIVSRMGEAKELLMNLSGSYLYKDVLSSGAVRRPALLEKLLVALALQVGSEVSYNELAQTVGTDNKTVEKYVDLLEKCYIVFRLNAFSRNLRTELKKSKKIYFYDNGIRNAVIQNFAPLSLRADVGALWENFVVAERIKENHYAGRYVKSYFWRTAAQQEIDYVEEADGRFSLFEMKWNPKKSRSSFPKVFLENYPIKETAIVTPDNYMEWLLGIDTL